MFGLSRAHNPSRSVDCSSESNVRGKAFRDKPFCVSAGVPAPSGVGSAQAFVDNDDTAHHGNNRWPSCATGDGSRHGPGRQAETIAAFYEFISDPKCTIGVPGKRIAELDVDGTLERVYELQIRLLIEPRVCWSSEQLIANESSRCASLMSRPSSIGKEERGTLHMLWNTYRLECHSDW